MIDGIPNRPLYSYQKHIIDAHTHDLHVFSLHACSRWWCSECRRCITPPKPKPHWNWRNLWNPRTDPRRKPQKNQGCSVISKISPVFNRHSRHCCPRHIIGPPFGSMLVPDILQKVSICANIWRFKEFNPRLRERMRERERDWLHELNKSGWWFGTWILFSH